MATASTAPAEAPTCPTFPASLAGHKYLLDTSTCIVWDTTTGTRVRTEWARGRGLPRLVFAGDCRPQLGEAMKRGLTALGFIVDKGAPRWPSIHGKSGVDHGALAFSVDQLRAVPRGRPAKLQPPTFAAYLADLNPGKAIPGWLPIEAHDGADVSPVTSKPAVGEIPMFADPPASMA